MTAPLAGSRLGWASFDFVAGLMCGSYGAFHYLGDAGSGTSAGAANAVLYGLLMGCCVAMFSCLSHFGHSTKQSHAAAELLLLTKDVCLSTLLVTAITTMLGRLSTSRPLLEIDICWVLGMMIVSRILWRRRCVSHRKRGRASRNFAVVGHGPSACEVRDYLTSLSYAGYSFKGFISLERLKWTAALPTDQIVVPIAGLVAMARSMFVDEIFFMDRPKAPALATLLKAARSSGIDVRLVPDVCEAIQTRTDVHYIGALPTVVLHRSKTREVSKFFKRLLDMCGALCALIVLAPIVLVLAVLIKMESPGPVFYASERVGLKGRVFRCLKFRTMVKDAHQLRSQLDHLNERDGILFKIANDPRITRVGGVLRKYSLDELPQFWNVLRGDMSMVGPRPPISCEVEQYSIDQFCRLEVPPGMTGLWQVEARADPSFESYIEFDRKYVNDWSIWLDLKILLRTFAVVARGTGT